MSINVDKCLFFADLYIQNIIKAIFQNKLRLDMLTFINFAHVHIAVIHLQGGL